MTSIMARVVVPISSLWFNIQHVRVRGTAAQSLSGNAGDACVLHSSLYRLPASPQIRLPPAFIDAVARMVWPAA
jgi:hypothetical protein